MPQKVSRRGFLKSLGAGVMAGSAGSVYVANCVEWLAIERHELRLPNWDADGFRIAVLSDFHLNSRREMLFTREAVRAALDEKADVIVLPGDFINNAVPEILGNIRPALEDLAEAKCPVLATMGNHDYWCGHPEQVIEELRKCPLRLLRNERFEVDGVTIAGVDDAIDHKDRYDFFPERQVSKSLVALLHEPDFVKRMPQHVSLQVSGHSHGGQVCLPFGIALHTPGGAKDYIAGFYENAPVPLYVSRGVGTTGPRLRLFCRPEVSVLTLRTA